ncbi:MAG: 4Fe-4S binding protein [Acidobacteria bacterium]|nr:4Fe-4S binding protein [Acidobacteriota bacterium]
MTPVLETPPTAGCRPFHTRDGRSLMSRKVDDPARGVRRWVQWGFLALNVWLGWSFYLWVRQFETGVRFASFDRPAGVEGWLPIAGMMNLKLFLTTGLIPSVHPAAMVLFVTFTAMSLLFRKAFCGWLCPVGTISEWLWRFGEKRLRLGVTPWKWLDIPLRSLKYILLALFLYAVGSMGAVALAAFLSSPYGLIADVKMLNFFREMGQTGAIVIAVLVAGSLAVRNFWCRYLCPYGALMGLLSLASPLRITRNPRSCIDCGACARVCPSYLPVDKLIQVKSAECIGCQACVDSCPVTDTLWLQAPARRRVSKPAMAAMVLGLFLVVVGTAKIAGHWQSPIPDEAYFRLIPHAAQFDHPR